MDKNQVAKIRATYSLERRVVVFHLPEMPGLPGENRNLKNLADMRIPYAQFDSQDGARDYVAGLLQLSNTRITGISISPFAPKVTQEFHNVTVGEMVQTLADKLDADVRVDGNTLVFEKRQTLRERMQEWWMKARALLRI